MLKVGILPLRKYYVRNVMQIGLRFHDAARLPLEQRLAAVRSQGFSCVQLALAKAIEEFPTDDAALTPGLAMYLRHLFEGNGLDIAVLGCYLNLATPDREELKRNMQRYKAHLRFASLLGCGVVGTETGCPNVEYKYCEECGSEDSLKLFIENAAPVVEYAEKTGTILAIEPVAKHIVCTPERALKVLEEIGSPNLRIIFDPVNLLTFENYRDQKQIVRNAIDVLGDYVDIIHVKDFRAGEKELMFLPAGQGCFDFSNLSEFIKTRKPYIQCTLEDTQPDTAVAAREFFERCCS